MKNWLISWGERTTARLRAKADAIRAEAERREREHLIRVAIVKRNADAVVAGREFERTAIVEWLRALPYRPWSAEVADRIWRGEHMSEMKAHMSDELERLRAENERLRFELAAEKNRSAMQRVIDKACEQGLRAENERLKWELAAATKGPGKTDP